MVKKVPNLLTSDALNRVFSMNSALVDSAASALFKVKSNISCRFSLNCTSSRNGSNTL